MVIITGHYSSFSDLVLTSLSNSPLSVKPKVAQALLLSVSTNQLLLKTIIPIVHGALKERSSQVLGYLLNNVTYIRSSDSLLKYKLR